jgi:hypothetical protein
MPSFVDFLRECKGRKQRVARDGNCVWLAAFLALLNAGVVLGLVSVTGLPAVYTSATALVVILGGTRAKNSRDLWARLSALLFPGRVAWRVQKLIAGCPQNLKSRVAMPWYFLRDFVADHGAETCDPMFFEEWSIGKTQALQVLRTSKAYTQSAGDFALVLLAIVLDMSVVVVSTATDDQNDEIHLTLVNADHGLKTRFIVLHYIRDDIHYDAVFAEFAVFAVFAESILFNSVQFIQFHSTLSGPIRPYSTPFDPGQSCSVLFNPIQPH